MVCTGIWEAQDALPALNTPRYSHSCCVAGIEVYVTPGLVVNAVRPSHSLLLLVCVRYDRQLALILRKINKLASQ